MSFKAACVVCVTIQVKQEAVEQFREALIRNAIASRREPLCHRFDIACDDSGAKFLLYEVYADRDAFKAHLQTPHFAEFSEATESWIVSKHVEIYTAVYSGDTS